MLSSCNMDTTSSVKAETPANVSATSDKTHLSSNGCNHSSAEVSGLKLLDLDNFNSPERCQTTSTTAKKLEIQKKRPHKCVECQQLFVRKAHLKSHLRIHINDSPYSCDKCFKSFKSPDYLARHLRTHAAVKQQM